MSESVSRTTLLAYLEKKNYVKFGNISTDWQDIVSECEQKVVDNPDYWCNLVPEPDDFDAWDNIGNDYITNMKKFQNWGYTSHNTKSWETTSQKLQIKMSWENSIASQLCLDDAVSRPTLQPPGNIMPWHQDQFYHFKRKYPDKHNYIVRFIVFMKDWEAGHLLQAGDEIVSHWCAGDIILWHPDRYHIAMNAGISNKWTQNVTGVLKENVLLPKMPIDI